MTCKKVSDLLAPYIEDALEAGDRALVEEHLEACEKCAAELASLRAYFKEMAALEELSPPKDFLQQVHARLDEEKGVKKIVRSLFVPLHIKIPMEAAAMAMVFFLLVWFVRDRMSETGMERIPLTAESRTVPPGKALEEKGHSVEAKGKMESQRPEMAKRGGKEVVEIPEPAAEEEPPEFAAAPPGEAAQIADVGTPVADRVPVEVNLHIYPETSSSTVVEYTPSVAVSTKKDRKTLPAASRDEEVRGEADKVNAEEKAEKFPELMKKGKGPSPPPAILDRIREWTLRLGGKVLDIENEGVPGKEPCITVELPADQYPSFLLELHTVGYIEEPPADTGDSGSPVRLRICLQNASRSRTELNTENASDSVGPTPAFPD